MRETIDASESRWRVPRLCFAGCTQAGKTTLLNTSGSAVPGRERIVSVEEVFELRFDHLTRLGRDADAPGRSGGHR